MYHSSEIKIFVVLYIYSKKKKKRNTKGRIIRKICDVIEWNGECLTVDILVEFIRNSYKFY